MNRALLFITAVLFSTLGAATALARSTVLRIGADPWCPYNCEQDAIHKGYLVDIAVAVFGSKGYRVEYQNLPWTRALIMVQSGELDAAVGVVQGNKGDLIVNRESLGKDETVLITRKGEGFTYSGPQSLRNKQLGVIADYTYDNNGELDQYINLRTITQPGSISVLHHKHALNSLFAMLLKKRIDIFPENQYVALNKARELTQTDLIEIVPTGASDDVHFGFRDDPEGRKLADLLDQGVKELKSTGKFAEILSHYGLGRRSAQ